jgi:hypothetical protein
MSPDGKPVWRSFCHHGARGLYHDRGISDSARPADVRPDEIHSDWPFGRAKTVTNKLHQLTVLAIVFILISNDVRLQYGVKNMMKEKLVFSHNIFSNCIYNRKDILL